MSKEAMKLALEALEGSTDKTLSIRAMRALQKELAQPHQENYMDNSHDSNKPVGSLSVRYHRGCKSMTNTDFDYNGDLPEGDYELYTSPPARKPLTDEQIDAAIKAWFENEIVAGRQPFAKRMRAAIKAANSIKENT